MSLRWFYISLMIAGLLIFSCSKTELNPESIDNTYEFFPQERPSPIQKIQLIKFSGNISEIYINNAIITKQLKPALEIGRLVDADIQEVVTKQSTIENKSWTSIFYSSSNPPVKFKSRWQVSIVFDNDIFDNRDYYYTNGFRIDLVAPILDRSPLKHILIGSKKAQIELNGFSFRQNMYTPTNPDVEEILVGDRPFSAYLTIGIFRETFNLRRRIHIKSELNIGIIGSSALGREVQAQIHEIEPVGWPNQIHNDFVLDYNIRISKGIVSMPIIEFNVVGKANIGTLYNKIGGGLDMRFGHFMPVYRGPLSVFEFINPGARLQYWMFLRGEVDVIGYDATMQGGMFNQNSPYVISSSDINRLVFQSSIGFAVYYNNIGIEYEHFYQTPEFNGAYHFGWGRLKAIFAF